MRIAITGATGFVGQALCRRLLDDGYEVLALSRDAERAAGRLPARSQVATWDPERGVIPANVLDGVDAVVSLAGTSVASGRWSARRKESIRRSRVEGTRLLVEAMARLPPERRPRTFLSASAVGYYGDRGDAELTEASEAGQGFLADVCRAWEAEALGAEPLGIRTVVVRTGIVLGRDGGALATMLPVFRLGLGGRIGSGRQWMSWIHLDDLVDLWVFALGRDDLCGPVNGVAPHPVTNADFTTTLGRVLARPTVLPVPSVALRIALGEMGAVLLEGQRVRPVTAEGRGFRFRHPELGAALVDLTRDPATTLVMEQWVPRPPSEVFAFFADAHNLERITPPLLGFRILGVSTPTMQTGTRIDYRLSLHGIPVRWQSLIRDWNPVRGFVDTQTRGPYHRWEHTHEFEARDGGTIIRDRVQYELPIGALGTLVAGGFVAKDLATIFTYRRDKVREIFGVTRLLAAFLLFVSIAGVVDAKEIEGVRFADEVRAGNATLRLNDVGLMRYRYVIKAYVAGLYLGAGGGPDAVLADFPKRLEIEYFYSIKADGFANATKVGIAANVDSATAAMLRPRIDRLNALYRDVQPGDRYALTYLPGVGTELALNGTSLGTIEGADFAAAVFAIWLGPKAIDESLKTQLLGRS